MKTTINLDVKQSVMNNAVKESMPAVARADSSRLLQDRKGNQNRDLFPP